MKKGARCFAQHDPSYSGRLGGRFQRAAGKRAASAWRICLRLNAANEPGDFMALRTQSSGRRRGRGRLGPLRRPYGGGVQSTSRIFL